jgi:RNA polymerase sigma-70 factor (ECF subfamily)
MAAATDSPMNPNAPIDPNVPLDATAIFLEQRPRLFGIAYRMLGSIADAEDVLQESFLRWQETAKDGTAVDSPGAFLATIVSRRCLDQLRSARHRREEYVGPWLPEPLVADERLDPARVGELADSLSMAFLVVLETLSPTERAAFLLHDVFGYGYPELSGMLERAEPACRQLVTRARRRLHERRPRFDVSPEVHAGLLDGLVTATTRGDIDGLLSLLSPDVVLQSDGGGKVAAARLPIYGADRVARLLASLPGRFGDGYSFEVSTVNGLPGLIIRFDGQLNSVLTLDVDDGQIRGIYIVANPEKLRAVAT